jgi:hypothetical protein
MRVCRRCRNYIGLPGPAGKGSVSVGSHRSSRRLCVPSRRYRFVRQFDQVKWWRCGRFSYWSGHIIPYVVPYPVYFNSGYYPGYFNGSSYPKSV